MKKLFAVMLALALALSCAACGSKPTPPAEPAAPAESAAASVAASEPAPESAPSEAASSEAVPEAEEEISYEIVDLKTQTWTDSAGFGWTMLKFGVKNTGSTTMQMMSPDYSLLDADGNRVGRGMSLLKPSILAPGETAYMTDRAALDHPIEGEPTVEPWINTRDKAKELVRLAVSDVELTADESGSPVLHFCAENTTGEALEKLDLVAHLFDAEGSCLGVHWDTADIAMQPGEKAELEISSFYSMLDSIPAEAVADYAVYVSPF